ncbi:MAG: tetratricopeptide repeat protein [Acidobacteria bacterium]|nr:MAG: tetratricopeptide repeat protein [Acidobacteriota bacterium]
MRRLATVPLMIALALALGWPAEGRSKRREAAPTGTFQLESKLLARMPDVAEALEQTRARPSDAHAWRHLGTVLSRRGAHDDALRAFDRAIRLDRRNADVWTDLGAAHIRAGSLRDAIEALETALEIEPFHALAHYNLGLAYQARKRYDDALEEFKAALLLEPDLGDPQKNPAAAINPALPYVRLAVYLETTGATPSLFSSDVAEQTEGEPGQGDGR